MAYLTVSKGFEPGGWVGIADGAPPVYGPNGEKTLAGFDPEEAIQYELGWKGSLQMDEFRQPPPCFSLTMTTDNLNSSSPTPVVTAH